MSSCRMRLVFQENLSGDSNINRSRKELPGNKMFVFLKAIIGILRDFNKK